MKKWSLLEEVKTPDGSLMTLHTHDETYVIRVNGRELMSTRHFASEEKLAEFACMPVSKRSSPRVLVGGLGLGFTLRAALRSLPQKSEVVVAELIPEVVRWNQNPAYGFAGDSLEDPRTRIEMGDVAHLIARSDNEYDAIMLDVDNGTTAMSTAGNKSLYQRQGLANIWKALRPGGVVVFWSAQEEPLFAKQLLKAGFKVDIQQVRAHLSGGSIHTLLIARRAL